MLPRNSGQSVDPVGALVEAGQEAKLAAPCFEERLPSFDADLFEGLQAVGDEAGADDVHAADPLAPVLRERRCGVGLEPRGSSEARLERGAPLPRRQAEAPGDESGGLVA